MKCEICGIRESVDSCEICSRNVCPKCLSYFLKSITDGRLREVKHMYETYNREDEIMPVCEICKDEIERGD